MRYETPLINEYGDIIRVEGMDDMADMEDSEETVRSPAFKLAGAEEPDGETRVKESSGYPDSYEDLNENEPYVIRNVTGTDHKPSGMNLDNGNLTLAGVLSGSILREPVLSNEPMRADSYDSSKEFDMSNYETIEKLEGIRKSLNRNDIAMTIVLLVIIFGGFFGKSFIRIVDVNPSLFSAITLLIPFIMMGCMIGIVVPKMRKHKVFQKEFKEKLVFPILRNHFDDLTYYWDGVFTNADVRGFGLTAMGNRFKTEDHITASYRGIKFDQADVVIRNKSGKHTYTYFSGRMFAFQYPDMKNVDRIKIYSKKFDYRASYGSMKRVHLENLNYDDKYDTYSMSEHDAFYLLTPQMMERLLELGTKYPNFAIHFCGKMVYVGVDNLKDSMDPPMNKPLDYVDIMQKIKTDVQVIKDLVDILELVPLNEDT